MFILRWSICVIIHADLFSSSLRYFTTFPPLLFQFFMIHYLLTSQTKNYTPPKKNERKVANSESYLEINNGKRLSWQLSYHNVLLPKQIWEKFHFRLSWGGEVERLSKRKNGSGRMGWLVCRSIGKWLTPLFLQWLYRRDAIKSCRET